MNKSSGFSGDISDREICKKAIVMIMLKIVIFVGFIVSLLKIYCKFAPK